ncbi:MAG: L,D-transpeptidase family protein, partial [Pseudohongiellaceae bacterium]
EYNSSPVTNAKVNMDLESPAWYQHASVRAEYDARNEFLPRMIPPGPENPLGSHALLLSAEGYLIHGTNKGFGVGMQASHGCFRMYNADISRFVYEVPKGTAVQVVDQPVKVGMSGGEVWLEVHRAKEEYPEAERTRLWKTVMSTLKDYADRVPGLEIQRESVEIAVDQADGIPRMIGERVARVAVSEQPQVSETESQVESDSTTGETSPQLWF